MGLIDYMMPKRENKQGTGKPQIPGALKALQDSLSPGELPSKRKRSRAVRCELEVPVSPINKKKKLVTTQLATPETTPIHKSSKLSVISSASVDQSAVKKLDFCISKDVTVKTELSEADSISAIQFPSPPVSPIKTPVTSSSVPAIPQDENKENITPTTTPKSHSIYMRAKAIFQRSSPVKFLSVLPERDVEATALENFLISHITSRESSSLYVSGPPGTGKTAQLKLTLSQFIDTESTNKLQEVEIDGKDYRMGYSYINCMTVSKTSNIYSEIYKNLTGQKIHIKGSREMLQQFLQSDRAHMSVIILDELDQMLGKQTDEVFTLFSWALTCKIVLIGISNALDMVDRLLPRLKMNGLSPDTLVFMPYTADQIAKIIQAKLGTLNGEDDDKVQLFHPSAIQLCAKKSASNTGDLRKAFDICRAAIESVEKEARGSNILMSKDAPANTVRIQHIARVTNAVFNAAPTNKLRGLNLSQKLLVCMLVKAENSNPFQTLTINAFYEYYTKNGKVDQLVGMLKKTEFLEVLSSLETNSVIRIYKSTKAFSESKVSSSIIKKDLAGVIKGVYVLEKLMDTNDQY